MRSNREWQIIYRPLQVRIIEFEDVLFHLNSCVMMPARPSGVSSQDGSDDDWRDEDDADIEARQAAMTGLDTIALVYREFEFDPSLQMLIAGHTDTSGGTAGNFTLSDERANNVLHILEGSRDDWADLCHARHKVEDFQQILTWVNQTLNWPCNPAGIDDDYGTNTKQATEAFIIHYNARYAGGGVNDPPPLASAPIMTSIRQSKRARGNGTHSAEWPVELWRAVFDIYMEQLADKIGTNVAGLPNVRGRLRFVSVVRKCAACGESFPVDDADREDYRSQLNRRVELLFFHQGELATPIVCQDPGPDVHTQGDCPIYHDGHFKPLYLDAGDLHGVAYHLKFTYYNRVRAEVMAVLEELQIQAVIESAVDGEDPDEIGTRTAYNAQTGVYTVIVQFATQDDADNKADRVQFSFETQDRWIHTTAAGADPTVVTRTSDQIDGYDFAERWQYYDLPPEWASANWRCKVGNDVDAYETHRTTRTAAGSPIEFNLDAIVLLDEADGNQDIKDENHLGAAVNLQVGAAVSRVKLFRVDQATHNLALVERKPGTLNTARIPFPRNFLLEDVSNNDAVLIHRVVIVHFRNGFYVVADKRTGDPHATQPAAYAHIRGARAAVRHDRDHNMSYDRMHPHVSAVTRGRDAEYIFTGDYDLHYFHHLSLEGDHPISFLIPHVSTTFLRDTRPAATAGVTPFATAPEVNNFNNLGVYNCMTRWNSKDFWFQERNPANANQAEFIRVFYFFDEKETFTITNANLPQRDFTVNATREADINWLIARPNMQTSLRNARGGRSKFLGFICNDSGAWHWGGRPYGSQYSAFKLQKGHYQDQGAAMGASQPVTNEFGQAYGVLTLAHELGHAGGLPDEYPYNNNDFTIPFVDSHGVGHTWNPHRYGQPCEQYSMLRNYPSMMRNNQSRRLHHLWYYLHFVNDETDSDPNVGPPNEGLQHFLNGMKFEARFSHGVTNYTFDRDLAGNPNLRANVLTPLHLSEHHGLGVANKELHLAMYDTGQDESSMNWFHPGHANRHYKGVIVVGLLGQVTFDNDPAAWTDTERAGALFSIQREWLDWGGRCRLIAGTTDLDELFIHFLPGFRTDASADTNYELNMRRSTTPAGNPSVYFQGGVVQVRFDATANQVVRFLMDAALGDSNVTALTFVRDWADTQMGDNFTISVV